MSVILTTSPAFAMAGDIDRRVADAGHELLRVIEPGPEMDAALAQAHYLVAGLPHVTAGVMDRAPHLKAILKHGVGVDNIDIPAATERGIAVLSAPGANAQAVAELAIGAIFALSRSLVENHAMVAGGGWTRRRGREIQGATLGIVGFGRIGQRVARMARGIGMQVIANDILDKGAEAAEIGVRMTGFDELVAGCDVLSLHVPGGPDTETMVNDAVLSRLRPGALLLNFARGSVVDTVAVADALQHGSLAGAALDAFVHEPPDMSDPIFSAPNVLLSPHTGADTVQAVIRTGEMVMEDIAIIEAGDIPQRALNGKELHR